MRRRVDDDCPRRQGVEITGEEDSVSSSNESTTTSMSLSSEASIEVGSQHHTVGAGCKGDSVAEGLVVIPSTKSAGPMTGGQRNRVIEKEQRRPGSRSIERVFPVPEFGAASDPQRPCGMTYLGPTVGDQTTAVPGE